MEIWPAIDLRNGTAVRLYQGDDTRRETVADPLEALERFAAAGAEHLHLVDLDAAFGEAPQRELIALLATKAEVLGIEIQLGGGLRDRASVAAALAAGASRAVIGSLLAREPQTFVALAEEFPDRLVPALDVRGGDVRIAGWTETAAIDLFDLCTAFAELPCPAVLVTDVERDGTMTGPNLALARRVSRISALPALVSGGIASLEDIQRAREMPEVSGVIIGRALYSGAFTFEQAMAASRGETFE